VSENAKQVFGVGTTEDRSRTALAEPLLDAAAAARLLSVRLSWIYAPVRTGCIPHLKIGRHIRFFGATSRNGS
jgi:excisionase family DNA binding protein